MQEQFQVLQEKGEKKNGVYICNISNARTAPPITFKFTVSILLIYAEVLNEALHSIYKKNKIYWSLTIQCLCRIQANKISSLTYHHTVCNDMKIYTSLHPLISLECTSTSDTAYVECLTSQVDAGVRAYLYNIPETWAHVAL